MFLKGKTALITGSTSGIGLAYARSLAAEGANIMLNGFGDPSAIEAERSALETISSGGRALYSSADMTLPSAITALVQHCHAELGGPDILVANAGINHIAPVTSFPVEKWDQIIAINLTSPFLLMQACIPFMKQKNWGRVICTASAHSMVASPYKSAYVAAKHGLVGLVKTVALEMARDGITVNAISPGYVWTPLVENQIPDTMEVRGMTREQVVDELLVARHPTRELVKPEQVAALALFLCREEARQVTGSNYSMDGGWTAG
ncbi:3-hydroxybutyrate dehydrogenase [Pseudomassariella vexata]|uniref:3-oxoacyl-[acyl-carrier-protein] reductase n=1 Tax=Pseudomassariella vexata TaxID=1141098 RepID=A0A1Y2DVG8_9PEZI|nr:3-hydroxybutyrate dehydrogenase [Pseudomassariella vexata]ORY63271.1 3-hydroxybutyrate dehydrogenase [Pseudomassariella vexata]